MAETIIRTQQEMDAFIATVPAAFERIGWETFLEEESAKLDKQYSSYFRSKIGPDGSQWAANAKSTIKRKGHARQLFGKPSKGYRLHKSLTTRNGEFSIRYEIDHWPGRATLIHGTDAPYSVYNDQGTRTIPARRHIGVSGQYFDGFATRTIDYAFDRLKKLLA